MERDDDLEDLHGEKRFTELVDLAEDLSLDAGVEGFMGNFLPHTARTAWRGEIPRYEKVAKAHPTLGIAWYNLGYAQLMADRPEAAAESLGKALEPRVPQADDALQPRVRRGAFRQHGQGVRAALRGDRRGLRRRGPHARRLGPRRDPEGPALQAGRREGAGAAGTDEDDED